MAIADDARTLLATLREGVSPESAFLGLYRFIDGSADGRFGWFPLGETAVFGVDCDNLILRWREVIRQSIGSDAPVAKIETLAGLDVTLESIAASGEISAQESKQLVMGLRVLDAAFRGVNAADTSFATDSPGLISLRTRLRKGQSLFQEAGFHVFPKPLRQHMPERRGQNRLSDLLDVLTVVREEPHLRLEYAMAFEVGTPGPEGFQTIGVVPTVNRADELLWQRQSTDRYSIAELPDTTDVHARVRQALDALLDDGAELILLPELVAGPELLRMLKQYLAVRDAGGLATPILLLAGTQMVSDEKGRRRNRAVVLDGSGDEIWCQDKLHAYCFTSADQAATGHPLGEGDLADRSEDIAIEPRTLVVIDLTPSQRLVVLTCEDFIQEQPHRGMVVDMHVTTLLVPIMAPWRARPPADGWVTDGAMAYVRHPGATSVVANSGTLVVGPDANEQWQYGEIRSSPRLSPEWHAVPGAPGGPPIAWLARLARRA